MRRRLSLIQIRATEKFVAACNINQLSRSAPFVDFVKYGPYFGSNGTIVEDGSHRQLLKAGGRYKSLWDAQVGGFLPQQDDVAVTSRYSRFYGDRRFVTQVWPHDVVVCWFGIVHYVLGVHIVYS